MPAPTPSAAAEELYAALEPAFTDGDEDRDWPLLRLLTAICAGDLAKIHEWVTDNGDAPGWQILLDPDLAPPEVLPWLAQFDGAVLRPDMDTEARRNAIKTPEAFGRGTLEAIKSVVARRLTGTKSVIVTERYTGNAWRLRIETIEAETPDPAAIEADLLEQQKPIGILLFFNTRVVWDWGEAKESVEHPTWGDVKADFATWFDYRTNEP